MIKGIMFDMGGTLVNVELKKNANKLIFNHLIDKSIKEEVFNEVFSRYLNDTLNVRSTFDIKCVDFFVSIATYFNTSFDIDINELELLYVNALFEWSLVDNVIDILEECKKEGLKMIVLSNTFFSKNAICMILKEYDLLKYFDDVLVSSEALVRKPSTLFFEMGIHAMNMDKNDIVYVGNDYHFDYMGCLMTGLKMIFLNHDNYAKYELFETCKEIKDYKELIGEKICQIF